jgi:hypothetical protein
MGEKRNVYRLLRGKPEGNNSLGRLGRRWMYNIKIDFRKIGRHSIDWIDLAQDRKQ